MLLIIAITSNIQSKDISMGGDTDGVSHIALTCFQWTSTGTVTTRSGMSTVITLTRMVTGMLTILYVVNILISPWVISGSFVFPPAPTSHQAYGRLHRAVLISAHTFYNHRVLRTSTKRRTLKRVNEKNVSSYLGILKWCKRWKVEREVLGKLECVSL